MTIEHMPSKIYHYPDDLPCSPYWNRWDICMAHLAFEQDWNYGGWLQERPSNQRRMEATHVQLHRMQFDPGTCFNGWESLSTNAKEIYVNLVARYFPQCIDEHLANLEAAYAKGEE